MREGSVQLHHSLPRRKMGVSGFVSPPLYPTGEDTQYSLIRRLDGPNNLPGSYGEKNTLASTENRTPTV
jgi:hypothetical protein